MMASSSVTVTNPLAAIESSMGRRRRKKKRVQMVNDRIPNSNSSNQWRSEARQKVYSSKLLLALRQVRVNSHPYGGRIKVVRETADRVLAVTARGKSKWSRAILKNRLKVKLMRNRMQRKMNRVRRPRLSILRVKSKNLPGVQRKIRHLGRLVPGCGKEELPVILEEAIDYISALQMQIRAMNNLLSAPSSGAD